MTRRLLFLCHANIARSPAAERIARHLLGDDDTWQVTSRGTHALVGHRIDPVIADALRSRRVATHGHRARQATPADLTGSDLVLAFESRHRAWALETAPASVRQTFTIRRAARLLPRGVDALTSDVSAYTEADDFADPFGQGPDAAAAAVDEIDALLRVILPALGAVDVEALPPVAVPRPTRRARARHARSAT